MSDRRYAELTVNVVRQLEALRKTVHIDNQDRFWTTVNNFSDLNSFYDTVTLLSWGAYFPPPDIDKELVHTHVFLVISGIVPLNVHGGPTEFFEKTNTAFGWQYRCCKAVNRISAAERRKKKCGRSFVCSGSISPVSDTWVGGSKSFYAATGLLFCWLNRLKVRLLVRQLGAAVRLLLTTSVYAVRQSIF